MATTLTGNWAALSGSNGTVYSSGGKVVSGDVTLNGSNTVLTISNGAVASDITNPSSSVTAKYISAIVKDGGTLAGGSFNELVIYEAGGSLVSGGTFSHGQFHDSGGTLSAITMTDGNITASSGSTVDDVKLTGGHIVASNGATVSNVTDSNGSMYVSNGGLLTSASLTNGAYLSAVGTGKVVDVTLASGTYMTVSAGGTTSGAVIGNKASDYIGYSGGQTAAVQGTDFDTTILSGGTETLYNRAVSISATISSGGRISAGVGNAGGSSTTNLTVVSAATVYAGGSIRAQNDTRLIGTVLSGGTLNLAQEGADGRGTVILNGGVESLTDRYVNASGDYIESGGTLDLERTNYSVNGDHLYYSGSVDFAYLGGTITSASMSTGDKLSVRASNGSTASIQFDSSQYTGNDVFQISGDKVTLVCFLEGTLIRTPDGERAVETLATGDTVLTWDWRAGRTVEKTLSWVGQQPGRVRQGLADDEAGYPVRIRAGAMAPGVPQKDLLVTPEHCLFIDNGFIPARMLVNGSSIVYDRTMTQFTVFHIETAEHAVLWSDGALSESYLDTGNRRHFAQIGGDATVLGRVRDWTQDAAAPLVTAREIVEPVFAGLVARAAELGLGAAVDQDAVTDDPDLHLFTQDGRVIRAFRRNDTHVMFRLPAGVTAVRIASRASRPSDTIGPFVDDRRALGVLAGKITLFATQTSVLSAYLHETGLAGWHGVENGACRWTAGDAHLSLERQEGMLEEGVLAIEILAAGPYLLERAPDRTAMTA